MYPNRIARPIPICITFTDGFLCYFVKETDQVRNFCFRLYSLLLILAWGHAWSCLLHGKREEFVGALERIKVGCPFLGFEPTTHWLTDSLTHWLTTHWMQIDYSNHDVLGIQFFKKYKQRFISYKLIQWADVISKTSWEWVLGFLQSWGRLRRWGRGMAPRLSYTGADISTSCRTKEVSVIAISWSIDKIELFQQQK